MFTYVYGYNMQTGDDLGREGRHRRQGDRREKWGVNKSKYIL